MALQELKNDAVQATVQSMLAFFDREDVNVPGNMVESIVSGKSMLRALLNGQLVLAQRAQEPPSPPATEDDGGDDEKKAA